MVGASVICVDLVVQRFPGHGNFRIQDSSVFLACSLSLSFGVMLFSALYSMLPSSKHYFKAAGYSDQAAGLALMGCFVAGFFGIQVVSTNGRATTQSNGTARANAALARDDRRHPWRRPAWPHAGAGGGRDRAELPYLLSRTEKPGVCCLRRPDHRAIRG